MANFGLGRVSGVEGIQYAPVPDRFRKLSLAPLPLAYNGPMSEGPHQFAWYSNLHRAMCEWGAMGFAGLSLVCAGCWLALAADPAGTVHSFVGPQGVIVMATEGAVEIRPELDNSLSFLGSASKFPGLSRIVTSYRTLELPGASWWLVRGQFDDGSQFTKWNVRVSLLCPAAISAIAAAVCFRRYRAWRRANGGSKNLLPRTPGPAYI